MNQKTIKIYTDGSTRKNGQENGGQGAWGFVVLLNDVIIHQQVQGVYNTTNQQCEMLAVANACEWAQNNYPDLPKIVYSDSAYVINCYKDKWYEKWLRNGWTGANKQPVKNQKLWEQLIPFFDNMLFSFQKVKGHSDNKYNNLIDELVQSISLSMVKK